ncbi:MAG: NTP transferase domain-containing protein [Planctomycetaceae bacterium]|nr:NTP transferase domain-containing protein [Planctomycetaceae bacterium]
MFAPFHFSPPEDIAPLPSRARVVLLPAAGISSRMGKHKLSLPLSSSTLIGQTLSNYLSANIDLIVIVRRPDDEQLVAALPESNRLLLVTPEVSPPDMKASLIYALAAVQQLTKSTADHLYLLSPPDMPLLNSELINQMLDEWKPSDEVLIPTYSSRRGHPVLFSDRIAHMLDEIPPPQGLNSLWKRTDVHLREIMVASDDILFDVDTPEDYAEARNRLGN